MFAHLANIEHHRESRTLRRLERASAEEVKRHSDERLAELLVWCKDRVPYYRRALEGAGERQIRQAPARVLADLPILEKRYLHEHFEELVAAGRPGFRVRRNATGGSTGETAQFLQDAAYRRWNRALLARFEAWAGLRSGGKKLLLWGIPRDVERAAGPLHRIRDRLLRRTTLNAYNMSQDTMQRYVATVQLIRPDLLRVFTQSGIEFARFLETTRQIVPVGSVTCSGAMLLPRDRELMQRAFGAPVRNSYGSREVGPIAAEFAPETGLLVSPATHRIEILRPDGMPTDPGEEGEIHVTLLINRVMPLIRYCIGDRGAWSDDNPTAGAPAWPRIGRLVGRTMEHVVAEDGTLRNSQLMSELVMHISWVRRFQWVQDARDRVELRVEPHRGHPVADEADRLRNELAAEMRRIIGPRCRFELSLHDRIAPSASGKYHYVICTVN